MQLVLCDIGNVVIRADHDITIRRLVRLGVPHERAIMVFANGGYAEFARGKFTGEAYHRYLCEDVFKTEVAYDDLVAAHDAHMFEVSQTVVDVIASLRVPVAFATDTNAWQTRRERELIDLARFGPIIRSDDIGCLKRDPGAFVRILSRLPGEVTGPDVVFVDDVPDHLDLAREWGMTVVRFMNPRFLQTQLANLNLL